MYSLRDDTNIDVTRHQDLLQRTPHRVEQITPLKTRVNRVYKLLLAHAGRRLITWGYHIHKKSGFSAEIPGLTPPYAIEKEVNRYSLFGSISNTEPPSLKGVLRLNRDICIA